VGASEKVGMAVVIAALVGGSAYYARSVIAPGPIERHRVGLMLLLTAMDRVDAVLGLGGMVGHLECESTGGSRVACTADVARTRYNVSFVNDKAVPKFKLNGVVNNVGERVVVDFESGSDAVPIRDVVSLITAFEGKAAVASR
jgi:hypothetical protein